MGVARPGAARAIGALAVAAAIAVPGCLATACSQNGHVKGAISSLASGKTIKPSTPQASAQPAVPSAVADPAPQSPARPGRQEATRHGAASAATPASGESSTVTWLAGAIIAAVVIAAIVLIVWIARRSRRRSAAAAGWRTRASGAYAKGAALLDAMSVAEAPGALSAQDAGLRWSDIQRRADDLAQTLYALREAALDEEAADRVSDVLASLHAVRSAMSAERVTGTGGQAAVQARLSLFSDSLQALHEPVSGHM